MQKAFGAWSSSEMKMNGLAKNHRRNNGAAPIESSLFSSFPCTTFLKASITIFREAFPKMDLLDNLSYVESTSERERERESRHEPMDKLLNSIVYNLGQKREHENYASKDTQYRTSSVFVGQPNNSSRVSFDCILSVWCVYLDRLRTRPRRVVTDYRLKKKRQ